MRNEVLALFCFFALAGIILVLPMATSYDLFDLLKEGLYDQSAAGTGSIGLSLLPQELIVFMQSPENITYNFSRQQNRDNERFIDLNVSANEPDSQIELWYYELVDVRHSLTVTDIFDPNISINAFRWENILTVFAEDKSNRTGNRTVSFFVFVPNSAPELGAIDEEIFVCESTALNYAFNASDVDEDVMTFVLDPENPFFVENEPGVPKFYVNHIQSAILTKSEVGFYEENISVKDNFDGFCCADSADTNITVIEVNNDPVVTYPGVKTVWTQGENGTLYLEMMIDDVEDGDENSGNLTINVSFSGPELFNITFNGIINYTANVSDIGVYDVSVCAVDLGIPVARRHVNISLCEPDNLGANDTGCIQFELTVTDQNRPPRIIEYAPLNLSFNATPSVTYFFNITKHDPDGTTPDGYWYVDGDLKKFNNGSIMDEFQIFWGCGIFGEHIVKAEITDGELNDSIQWNVTVLGVACPPGESGGGGGGGGSGSVCVPRWTCNSWRQCQIAEESLQSGALVGEDYRLVADGCALSSWEGDSCGVQERVCRDLNDCGILAKKPTEVQQCFYTINPTCFDGIENCHDGACEFLVDCGGSCGACATCSDGIQNQGEGAVDCGGPCPQACEAELPERSGTPVFFAIFFVALLIALGFIAYRVFILGKKFKKPKKLKIRR